MTEVLEVVENLGWRIVDPSALDLSVEPPLHRSWVLGNRLGAYLETAGMWTIARLISGTNRFMAMLYEAAADVGDRLSLCEAVNVRPPATGHGCPITKEQVL